MARIQVPTDTLVGRNLIQLAAQVVAASQSATRLKNITDQITNNGAQKAQLETWPESKMPVGTANAIYAGIDQIKTALDGLSVLLASIDVGA